MKFNHKIMLFPLVTALAFALFFVLTYRATNQSSETISRIQDEFFHALELSHDLETDLLTISHLLNDAFTNGNEESLDEAAEVAERFRGTVAACQGVPSLYGMLSPLEKDFDLYFSLASAISREVIEQDRELTLEFGPEHVGRIQDMNRKYQLLREKMTQVVDDNNEKLETAIETMRKRIVRIRQVVNITSLVFLLVLVILSLVVAGSILRPVNRMSRMALSIADGDLGRKLEHQSDDALGELADSFRRMQAALISEFSRREKAEVELIAAQGQMIQSEKMVALGKLVAGLAHELNTPLGTLASSVDVVGRSRTIISEKCRGEGTVADLRRDARFQRALRGMEQGLANMGEAAGRINTLVAGLKSFSQLDKAERQLTDVNEGVRTIMDLVTPRLPVGVALHGELGEAESLVGYPAQLNQLFLNLVQHAVQDVEPPGTITLTTKQIAGDIHITVTDTGRGYAAGELEALFNPNFKADTDRVRMDWGLVACNRIVALHGGLLSAASEPGRGTTYRIVIPLLPKDSS